MINDFSSRMKELRLNMHLRQEQVANLVGVTKNAISTYENGSRQPSFEVLVRLSVIYRVSTDYLLGVANSHCVDLSGLTEKQAVLITDLVQSMSEQNSKLSDNKKW